ncbi:hypothetical protein HHI36_013347, partial [Cryptolaemus montrouzieri]
MSTESFKSIQEIITTRGTYLSSLVAPRNFEGMKVGAVDLSKAGFTHLRPVPMQKEATPVKECELTAKSLAVRQMSI